MHPTNVDNIQMILPKIQNLLHTYIVHTYLLLDVEQDRKMKICLKTCQFEIKFLCYSLLQRKMGCSKTIHAIK